MRGPLAESFGECTFQHAGGIFQYSRAAAAVIGVLSYKPEWNRVTTPPLAYANRGVFLFY